MTHEQLIVAQAEAFTILRDLMHIKPDDPRPQRIINTIKQAALAILRLKPPLSRAAGENGLVSQHHPGEAKSIHTGEGGSSRQRERSEGGPHTRRPGEAQSTSASPRTSVSCEVCPVSCQEAVDSLPDPQFDELIARLPHNTLYPRTDKQRDRLARHFAAYHLECTDDVKTAIVNRASRRSSHSDTAPQAPPHAAPRRAA